MLDKDDIRLVLDNPEIEKLSGVEIMYELNFYLNLLDHEHAYTYEMIAEYDDMINMMEVFSENVQLFKCYDEEKN